MTIDHKRLSKTIAVALRHAPENFGLGLDAQGWTPVEDLLAVLRQRHQEWQDLTEADLAAMIDQSTKHRYEISDGKIRA